MKIRINGNFIRLRLSQSEVNQMSETGIVSITSNIPGGSLTYSLRSENVSEVTVLHLQGALMITSPENLIKNWIESDDAGFENSDQSKFRILIEKDFQCLHKRTGEDESDNFANPAASE